MVGDALTSLEKAGRTQPGSRRELADSPIGVVVKAGAPLPAIHNADQLRATLLAAPSVAYSDSASGRYVSSTLFHTLGIDDAMQSKAQMVERIPVASEVAKGRYAIGFQQVSELLLFNNQLLQLCRHVGLNTAAEADQAYRTRDHRVGERHSAENGMLPGGHRHRGHGGNADARFHHPQHRGDMTRVINYLVDI